MQDLKAGCRKTGKVNGMVVLHHIDMELKFLEGSMIAIDTIAVENRVADNMYQRSELDYLIYNDPIGYADLILKHILYILHHGFLKSETVYIPMACFHRKGFRYGCQYHARHQYMRQFYLTFPNGYALRSELSWTHYRLLMRVENENAREFYMQEAVKSQWSTRQLERQINSFFYERLLSSKNKEQVAEEIQTLEPAKKPEDVIRDPYVLEFLGLKSNDDFYESDLEQALITHLQKFLLELGRGFSFVARQKRITFDGRHFRIDLVFYNYILKCFVLIDLKVGDLTHQDLGQMQMYVHYYERELMNEGDNPPIGIVLCADKSESVVKYTLPENETQIFASKYKLYLPSEEELLRELKQEYQALESIKALEENSGSED